MSNWVRTIAIALTLKGCFSLVCSLFAAFASMAGPDHISSANPQTLRLFLLVAMGAGGAVVGGAELWAGLTNLRYRGRTLGIVALSLQFLDPLTSIFVALPANLALGVLGLIVYLGADGKQIFAWGEAGCSPLEVERAVQAAPPHKPAAGVPTSQSESHTKATGQPLPNNPAQADNTRLWVVLIVVGGSLALLVTGTLIVMGIYAARRYSENNRLRQNAGENAASAEAINALSVFATGMIQCGADNQGRLPKTSAAVPNDLNAPRRGEFQFTSYDWQDKAYRCDAFQLVSPPELQYQWVREDDSRGYVVGRGDSDFDGKADVEHRIRIHCYGRECRSYPLEVVRLR